MPGPPNSKRNLTLTLTPEQRILGDPSGRKFFGPENRTDALTNTAPEDGLLYQSRRTTGPASHLSVLGVAVDNYACGYLRICYPLMTLAALGAKVEVRVLQPGQDIPLKSFFDHDIIFTQRQCDPDKLQGFLSMARASKKILVYDLDDYLHGVDPRNPAYGLYNHRTTRMRLKDTGSLDPENPLVTAPIGAVALSTIDGYLAESALITVSTRELAGAYRQKAPHAFVLENGLDFSLGHRDWDVTKPRFDWRQIAARQGCVTDEDSLLFGWSGSESHELDLDELGSSVSEVLSRTENTFFGIQCHPRLAYKMCVKKWRLPLDRVVFIPPVPFREYPRVLSAFDVCLAPLANIPFNHGKSALRVLEFAAWGIPYVASNVAPFHRFHRETGGVGGHLVHYQGQWADKVVGLLTDAQDRQGRGSAIRQIVRDRYDVRRTWAGLAYTFQAAVLARKTKITPKSLLEVRDESLGLPHRVWRVGPKDPCPCGSGTAHALCGGSPAWGKR